jgi:hypothetical protein
VIYPDYGRCSSSEHVSAAPFRVSLDALNVVGSAFRLNDSTRLYGSVYALPKNIHSVSARDELPSTHVPAAVAILRCVLYISRRVELRYRWTEQAVCNCLNNPTDLYTAERQKTRSGFKLTTDRFRSAAPLVSLGADARFSAPMPLPDVHPGIEFIHAHRCCRKLCKPKT